MARRADGTIDQLTCSGEEAEAALAAARATLVAARKLRPAPHLDDKVLTSWNGLMVSSLITVAQGVDGTGGSHPWRGRADLDFHRSCFGVDCVAFCGFHAELLVGRYGAIFTPHKVKRSRVIFTTEGPKSYVSPRIDKPRFFVLHAAVAGPETVPKGRRLPREEEENSSHDDQQRVKRDCSRNRGTSLKSVQSHKPTGTCAASSLCVQYTRRGRRAHHFAPGAGSTSTVRPAQPLAPSQANAVRGAPTTHPTHLCLSCLLSTADIGVVPSIEGVFLKPSLGREREISRGGHEGGRVCPG